MDKPYEPFAVRLESIAAPIPPSQAVRELAGIAKRLGLTVRAMVNDRDVFAVPGETGDVVLARWEDSSPPAASAERPPLVGADRPLLPDVHRALDWALRKLAHYDSPNGGYDRDEFRDAKLTLARVEAEMARATNQDQRKDRA